MGILTSILEKRANLSLTNPDDWWEIFQTGGRVTSGVNVTPSSAQGIGAVQASVDHITRAFGRVSLDVVRKDDNGQEKLPNHPLYNVLKRRPNPMMTSFRWRQTCQSHVFYYGNSYNLIERDNRNAVKALWPMMPDVTSLQIDGEGRYFYMSVFNDRAIQLPITDVLHVRAPGYNGLVGESYITKQREMFGNILASQQYEGAFFGNRGNLGVVLSAPGKVEDKDEVIKQFNELNTGTKNAFKTAILQKGMTLQNVTVPPEAAKLIETRRWNRVEVATLLGAPPHVIGEPSKYNNRELDAIEFVKMVLEPWCKNWAEEMENSLLRDIDYRSGMRIMFDSRSLMSGDHAARAEYFKSALGDQTRPGWMSQDEVRALDGLNKRGLDDIQQPVANQPEPEEEEAEDEETVALRSLRLKVAQRELTRMTRAVKTADKNGEDLEDAFLQQAERVSDALDVDLSIVDKAMRQGLPDTPEQLLERLEL